MKKNKFLVFICCLLFSPLCLASGVVYFGNYKSAVFSNCLNAFINRIYMLPGLISFNLNSRQNLTQLLKSHLGKKMAVYSVALTPGVNGIHRVDVGNLRQAMIDGAVGQNGYLTHVTDNTVVLTDFSGRAFVIDIKQEEARSYAGLIGTYFQVLP